MPTVTVNIPEGQLCAEGMKRCIFARYTKKWNAYNCTIHHKVLKGGQQPRKCRECEDYCMNKELLPDAHARTQDGL